ncbi:MAG: SHOCT-like domain-containing protein [Chloroflexota bacterium]
MRVSHRIGRYLWGRRPSPDAEPAGMTALAEVDPGHGETEYAGRSEMAGEGFLSAEGEGKEETEMVDDERMQILKMVEEHKITAEEGARLLAALEVGSRQLESPTGRGPRWIRIRVTDVATGRAKVNVNVPMGVVTAAGKLGARFGLAKVAEKEGIDLEELFQAIQSGAEGKLVDVTDEQGHEHVEVYVE